MRKLMTVIAGILCLFLTSCGSRDAGIERMYEEVLVSNEEQSSQAVGADEEEELLYVHVCGAVKAPGVYTFSPGARCCAAVEAAGGFLENADQDRVNLALPLTDGQKLYIPAMGEELSWEGNAGSGPEYGDIQNTEDTLKSGLVNINTADAGLLMTLPGIGETRAQSILAYRDAHGRFRSPEELMQVDGIKEKVYGKLKDFIVTE